jgi:hypothetical protein
MRPRQQLILSLVASLLCAVGYELISQKIHEKHEEAKREVAVKTRNLEQATKYTECELSAKTVKDVEDCESLRPAGVPNRGSVREQFDECVTSDTKVLESLDVDKRINWDDLKRKISSSCDQALTLSGDVKGLPEIQNLKKEMSAHYLYRALLKDNAKIIRDPKLEESFSEAYSQLAINPQSYDKFEAPINRGVEKSSIVATVLSLDHTLLQCVQAHDKVCGNGLNAVKALEKKGYKGIEEYWAAYYHVIGEKALAAEHATAYSEQGDYDYANFLVDQSVNDFNKALSGEWAKVQLANFHLRGRVSAFLQYCAETMVTAPWVYSRAPVDVSGFTPMEWKAKVTAWANPNSNEFHPDLFLRFACEKLSDPKARERAFRDYKNDLRKTFSQGFDFCSYFKDPAYSSACK